MTIVSYTLETLPPPNPKELQAIDAMSDDDIDYSDIPANTPEQLAQFYRPIKKQVTAKIDADVLAWLKSKGKGYQTRMNNILRQAMLEERQFARE
ncbi:hypothetical protein A4G20_07605 [Pasteurellaceae bacterium RH1A]|nr:hypothetical protein A4G20_07605 [Pasteurellaceae bacterium RH1A]